MYDEPETWSNLAAVCKILKEAGAISSKRAGAHVHVGVGDYDHRVENHTRLINSVKNNEDLLYRLSANPSTKTHRGLGYCSPNTSAPESYASISDSVSHNIGHNRALNLQSVKARSSGANGRDRDHVEFRTFDSSLEASVIQAQIGVAVYMTEAALRVESPALDSTRRSFGDNARLLGRNEAGNTLEEWNQSTLDMRKFLDKFVPGSDSEKDNPQLRQLMALYAVTRWQENNGFVQDGNLFDTLA